MADLAATIIIDYQNMHLTGHQLFRAGHRVRLSETLLDPLRFATTLIDKRNRIQRPGHAHAVVYRVLVFRGLPSAERNPTGYALGLAEKSRWESDPRVTVTLRPLQYVRQRNPDGSLAQDSSGLPLIAAVQEKGIDVLCALALVRESQRPDVDLVVLASHDSDLEPALDEALRVRTAKVETCRWMRLGASRGLPQLRPTDRSYRIWNTKLEAEEFEASIDISRRSGPPL